MHEPAAPGRVPARRDRPEALVLPGRMVPDEASDLMGELLSAMDQRQDMSAWFLTHPRALTPAFGAVLERFIRSAAAGPGRPGRRTAFAITCAHFTLRVQRDCRRHGTAGTLIRLHAAPGALGRFNALIKELNGLIEDEDLLEDDKPLRVARKVRDLAEHPAVLIGTEQEHARLMLWAAQLLRTLYQHTLSAEVLDVRIQVARAGLDPPPVEAAWHSALLDQLAFALADVSEQSGDNDPMREAAGLHEQALSMTHGDDPERAGRLNSLGACFRDLYRRAGQADGLDKAIALFGESAGLLAATLNRGNLAVSLLDRFRRDGATADLDRAITEFAAIAADARDDDPELPRLLANHAEALLARSGRIPDGADLARAIELTERALALRPAGSVLMMCRAAHAAALSQRATRTRDRAEFGRAVGLLERTRAELPAGSVLAEHVAAQHVMAVMAWWLEDRSDDNLRSVVTAARAALAAIRHDRASRTLVANLLLATAPVYAVRTGDVTELDRALREVEEEAACLAEAAGYRTEAGAGALPVTADVPAGLARLHIERGRRTSSAGEVEQGLDLVAAVTDPGVRAELTARGWTERFMLSLDASDLERALIAAEPLPATPEDSFGLHTLWDRLDDLACTDRRLADGRDLPGALADLWRERAPAAGPAAAVGYAHLVSQARSRRYQRSGDVRDLELAIDVLERQLAAVPVSTPRYRNLQVLAGARWRELYTATGDPAHVARAIAYLEEARDADQPGSRLFRMACGNLGTAFRATFNYTGDLGALDRAIVAYELSLGSWPGDGMDGDWPTVMANLANALRASYDYTRERARLDRAIELHEQVVAARPPGDPDRPHALHNLASACHLRYLVTSDPADLDRAVTASTEAVAGMAAGTPVWQDSLSSLGSLHETRFRANGNPADLDAAVRLSREAVTAARSSAWSRMTSLLRLAHALEARYDHGRDASDRAEAVTIYRRLCQETAPFPGESLMVAASRWASWAVSRQAWQEAVQACRAGTQALGELLRMQVSRGMRTRLISRYWRFTADAVYAFTRAGDHRGAVVALEVGRAVSFSEALELHTADLDWLNENGHKELAARFQAAVQRWLAASGEGLDRQLAGGEQPRTRDLSDRDASLRAARAEIDELADTIRDVSGDPGFLRPPVFADVAAAATAEPLVYLVAAQPGGVALVVSDDQVQLLDLPGLTQAAVAKWVLFLYTAYAAGDGTLNWWTRLESLGRELWDAVVGPLAGTLDGGPVTLVRTGYLELLPLNAAWTPDESRPCGRRYAVDELTLRSVPNARVLTAARARSAAVTRYRLLAVADPQPVTAPALTGAAAEVAGVRGHFAESTVLTGAEAVPEAVLAGLRSHEVIHCACHGSLDPRSPLASSLLLGGDRPLTLHDIMRIRLDRDGAVRLAVLSACESSLAGFEVPDEVISLPSGLLEAGVAGVVASQWRVPDLSAAVLMIRFHAEWASTGGDPAAALRAAQRWMRDSTSGEIAAFFSPGRTGVAGEASRTLWRSLVRMDPQRRGFAHPVHWAGFVFTGA